MGFRQYGKAPPLKIIQELAEVAGFNHWNEAKRAIQEVVESIADFSEIAKTFPITQQTVTKIQRHLDLAWQENKLLCS